MSQKPVQLVPLLCVRCQAPVPARVDEVAWVCEQCGQGLMLDDTPEGKTAALALDIFFSNAIPQGKPGHPFWVSSGKVTFTRRETYKGNESKQAEAYWSAPRLFFIPAFQVNLDQTVALGTQMLDTPFSMQAGSPTPFLPVVNLPDDMHAMAEFIVMSVEAKRRDALKHLEFTIELQPPQLWVIP